MGLKMEARRPEGFTLIEILIVVAIIAILALAILPNYVGFDIDARVVTTKSNLGTLRNRISLFRAKEGKYPSQLEDLLETTYSDAGIQKAYLKAIPSEIISDKSGNHQFRNQTSKQRITTGGGWIYLTDQADVVINFNEVLDSSWEDYEGQNPSEW